MPSSEDSLLAYDKKAFFLRPFENISIDKMAILFDVPKFKENSPVSSCFWSAFKKVVENGTTKCLSETPLYRWGCEWNNTFIVHWGVKLNEHETVRLEFNPNHSRLIDLLPFLGCFSEMKISNCRVSRMDVAVDYFRYINPNCWLVKNTPSSASFEYSGICETRYFGSSASDVQIRFYNKMRELKAHGELSLPDCLLWRCEAQIKKIAGDSWFLENDKAVSGFNPFSRMEFYDPAGINTEDRGAYGLFVEAARNKNIGFACSFFNRDRHTRNKYLDLFKSEMRPPVFNLPAEVYKNCFGPVYSGFVKTIKDICKLAHQGNSDSAFAV